MTGYLINATDITSYNAIGSYCFGLLKNITGVNEGSSFSGSTIFPSSQMRDETTQGTDTWGVPTYTTYGATGLTGTWRAMGRTTVNSGSNIQRQMLYIRIT